VLRSKLLLDTTTRPVVRDVVCGRCACMNFVLYDEISTEADKGHMRKINKKCNCCARDITRAHDLQVVSRTVVRCYISCTAYGKMRMCECSNV